MPQLRRVLRLFAPVIVLAGLSPTARPALAGPFLGTGEVLVADFQAAVYRVDRTLGSVGLVGVGDKLSAPFNIVASANGRSVYVADQSASGGSIIRIDLATGVQTTLVSGNAVYGVGAIALGSDGYLYAGRQPGPLGPAAIVRIDPQSGVVTPVSIGGMLSWPRDLEFALDGSLYVLEALYVDGGAIGAVLRVNVGTGAQSIVSSGGFFQAVQGMGSAANGLIYVVDSFAADRILRIDGVTGEQAVVSENGLMCLPRDVAVERDGNLLVTDGCASVPCPTGSCSQPAILRISLQGGGQTILTSDKNLTEPSGLVIFMGGNVTASTPTTWGAIKASYR